MQIQPFWAVTEFQTQDVTALGTMLPRWVVGACAAREKWIFVFWGTFSLYQPHITLPTNHILQTYSHCETWMVVGSSLSSLRWNITSSKRPSMQQSLLVALPCCIVFTISNDLLICLSVLCLSHRLWNTIFTGTGTLTYFPLSPSAGTLPPTQRVFMIIITNIYFVLHPPFLN